MVAFEAEHLLRIKDAFPGRPVEAAVVDAAGIGDLAAGEGRGEARGPLGGIGGKMPTLSTYAARRRSGLREIGATALDRTRQYRRRPLRP